MSEVTFQTRSINLEQLKEAVGEGRLKKRYKVSRYMTLLDSFKKSKDPAMEVSDLTTSQLTQLQTTASKVLGKGKVSIRTIQKSPDGKKSTVWVIKVGPQTKPLLEVV